MEVLPKTFAATGPYWKDAGNYTIIAQYGLYTNATDAISIIMEEMEVPQLPKLSMQHMHYNQEIKFTIYHTS